MSGLCMGLTMFYNKQIYKRNVRITQIIFCTSAHLLICTIDLNAQAPAVAVSTLHKLVGIVKVGDLHVLTVP